MKKIILFLAILTNSLVAQQLSADKIIISACYQDHGWYITFENEDGSGESRFYSNYSLGSDTVTFNVALGLVKNRLDTLPYTYDSIVSVQLISYSSTNGILTIAGPNKNKKGKKLFPVTIDTKDLTGNNATIKSNFYSFVHNQTGQNLSTLIANFDGSDSIYINGIKMNTDTADSLSGGLVMQAKQMCLLLLNGSPL